MESMTNFREEPQAKSRTLSALKIQVFGFILFHFGCFSFRQGDDLHGFFGRLCLLPAGELGGSQYLLVVLALAGSADDVVCRYGHFHIEVTEGEGELTATGELVVLPALKITVHAETGIPLCHREQIVAVFGKIFVAAAAADFLAVGDAIVPVYLVNEFLTRF